MNIANKITLFRVALVPVFIVLLLVDAIPHNVLWGTAVFIIASLTDMVDGQIARKFNMITDFGKFLDPLADKVLVVSALICFIEVGWAKSWVVIIIVAREFLVTSLRLVASDSSEKVVIAASIWGKLKTVMQMVAIIAILFLHSFTVFSQLPIILIGDILLYIATLMTVISGVQYMWDYRKFINVKK